MINKNSIRLSVITITLICLLTVISYSIRSGNDLEKEGFADEIAEELLNITTIASTTDAIEDNKNVTSMTSSGISFEVPAPAVTEEVVIINNAQTVETAVSSGGVLTPSKGVNYGPSGKETYYNLDMSGCIETMRSYGNTDEYWVREDGCKMLGPYIMCAANLNLRPRGTLVESSLGTCIVVDTGGFASVDATQIDIATTW